MINHTKTYTPTEVSAPGETLREILDDRSISQADLATRMGRPQKTISEIVNGKAAITTETALELELVLSVPATFWLAREAHYRESLARIELQSELEKGREWCLKFPVRSMERFGWIPPASDWRQRVRSLLEFFGVASAEQWETVHRNYAVAFRHPHKFASDKFALSAWLRAGVREAQSRATADYDRQSFVEALAEARLLTKSSPAHFTKRLPECMARAGVVVVFIPELPESRASGATQWISATKALVQLSLRYKTDDHLWFTFFHEAAHVLLHSKKAIFIELNEHKGEEEDEANSWAADFLIPREQYAALSSWTVYSRASVGAFADRLGIAPGIAVGRLQHDGLIPHSRLNEMKQRFEWTPARG